MPNGPLPKYRHHKARNLAVVRIDGRDHYLGDYDSPDSWEKYHRLLAERSRAGAVPTSSALSEPSAPALTVGELMLRFVRERQSYYRRTDGTETGELQNYRHAFRPLRALFSTTSAAEFGPKSLKLVRQRMIDSGLSRRVINRRVQRIVGLFAWGVENELLSASAHHALKAVKSLAKGRTSATEPPPVRPVDDALVDATLPFLTRQLRAVVEIQRLTGARSSEVLVTRTGDIDATGTVWTYTPGRHKGDHHGKERQVFLGPQAQAIVRQWLRPNPSEYLFQPAEARDEWDAQRKARRRSPMTPSQRGRKRKPNPRRKPAIGACYDARAYGHAVKRACRAAFPHPHVAEELTRRKALTRSERRALDAELVAWKAEHRAGLKEWERAHHWHPHQLRHSAATRLRREYGIEVARIVLGHESPTVTALYAEADQEKAREVMARAG